MFYYSKIFVFKNLLYFEETKWAYLPRFALMVKINHDRPGLSANPRETQHMQGQDDIYFELQDFANYI